MTVIRKNIIRKVKDITIGSTLLLTLMGGLQSCRSNNDGAEGSYEEAEVYTKGVKTYIKEVSKDEFKITDEVQVPVDSAVAIVTYLNGKQDTLKPELVKSLIDKDMNETNNNNNNGYYRHHNSLSNVLLYGGMGYMLANMMGNKNNQYASYRQQYERQNNSSSTGVYASAKAYENSRTVHQTVGSSKVTVSRPSGSRSGFFHGSSRSSYSG